MGPLKSSPAPGQFEPQRLLDISPLGYTTSLLRGRQRPHATHVLRNSAIRDSHLFPENGPGGCRK